MYTPNLARQESWLRTEAKKMKVVQNWTFSPKVKKQFCQNLGYLRPKVYKSPILNAYSKNIFVVEYRWYFWLCYEMWISIFNQWRTSICQFLDICLVDRACFCNNFSSTYILHGCQQISVSWKTNDLPFTLLSFCRHRVSILQFYKKYTCRVSNFLKDFSGLVLRSNKKAKERIAIFFWFAQNPMKMKTKPVLKNLDQQINFCNVLVISCDML
jgi:hypothetical protein